MFHYKPQVGVNTALELIVLFPNGVFLPSIYCRSFISFFPSIPLLEKKIKNHRCWRGRSESDHAADSCLAVLLCLSCFSFSFDFIH